MKRALIIAGRYTQDHEFIYPFYRLQEDDFQVDVAVKGKQETTCFLGAKIIPTIDTDDFGIFRFANEFDLLVLPGGAKAMEYLRQEKKLLDMIKDFDYHDKVIASICHGSQLLISAGVIHGREVSGYYSIKDDINNAGGVYVDAPVVVDENLVTSPHYKYLGIWMKTALDMVKEK